MHKKWTFPQPFQHRSRLLFYHEGVSCALFQQMPGVFHISQGSKKNFSTAKIFFRRAFLVRSAISTKNKQPTPASRPHNAKGPDMHFSTEIVWKSVETCGKMTVNSPSFRQVFPSPTLHSHRNFRVPRSARDHFLPRIFSSSPPEISRTISPRFLPSAKNPCAHFCRKPFNKNTPILSSKTSEKSPRNTQKPLTNAHLYSKLIDACKLGHRRCEYETHISAKE